jgi:ornithine cyclodeaminase
VGVPFIGAEDLVRLLPMREAIDALDAAFGADALPEAPLRSHLDTPDGSLLVMPAVGPQGVGVKLVTLTPANPGSGLPFIHAAYALFEPGTQALRAVLDGSALTALRTAAVSGLATRYLARPDAKRLAIVGAGVQARSHLESMRTVLPVEDVVVISRTPEPAAALAAQAGAAGRVGRSEDIGAADVVCTCTTSSEPVVAGAALRPGTHVNAVGAYTPRMREIDSEGVRRARVVVETREAAMAEAGDLLIAMKEGAIGPDHIVADLAEVVKGAPVRTSPEDVTLFKSVGVAFEDLVVASAVVARL